MSNLREIKLRFNYFGEIFETKFFPRYSKDGEMLKSIVVNHNKGKDKAIFIYDDMKLGRSLTPDVLRMTLITVIDTDKL